MALAVSPSVTPSAVAPAAHAIPLRELAPWLLWGSLVALAVLFFVSADQGVVSLPAGTAIHEWVHDGRHLLGFPCH